MRTAMSFLEANLKTKEHIETLEKNFELARIYAREKMELPPIPTIDDLEKYPELVALEKPKNDKKVR